MLTFEHFCDRPTWAAAAGYKFNIIDCLSEAMVRVELISGIKQILMEIPDMELREAWYKLPLSLLVIVLALAWPLIFWIFGVVTYVRCTKAKNKYRGTNDEIVLKNIRVWKYRFDNELNGKRRRIDG